MLALYYGQSIAVGISILAIIFFSFRKVTDRRQTSHMIFLWTLLPILLNLLLEPAFGYLSGKPGAFAGIAVKVVAALYFVLQPVPEALWIAYLFSIVNKDSRPSRTQWLLLLLPFACNVAFTVISLFGEFTFAIDAANTYHRGRFYLLVSIVGYSYMLYYICYAVRKRDLMLRHEFWTVFGSWLPTIVANVVQTLFPGVYVIWLAASFTMLILYINIMVRQANTDCLTGLANRRRFDGELESAFSPEGRKTQTQTAGIMIDVDHFKDINDHFGHLTGDRVLEAVSGVLRRNARKGDLVARYGGDEFVILADVLKEEDVERIVDRIRGGMVALNRKRAFPFPVELSFGSGLYDGHEETTASAFLQMIDNRMYEEKRANRRRMMDGGRAAVNY